MKCPSLFFPVALLVWMTGARCVSAGREDALPIYYARDERTEIALSPSDGGAGFEFRAYGSAREGRLIYHAGDLANGGDGVLRYEAEVEGRKSAVTITGHPGDEELKVEAEGLGDVKGSYRKLTIAAVVERARRRYEAADAVLNADYKRLNASLNAKQKAELREAQRDWIERRDRRAAWETKGAEDAENFPAYWEELLLQTVTRLGFLKSYTGKGVPAGLSGAYDDFEGGLLSLELTKTGLRFSIEVVRGPSLHLGEISGLALRKNDRFFQYVENIPKDEQSPERPPAGVTFKVVDSHRVRIEGKNTGAHHGARAYFDGLFYKAGPLEKPIEVD